MTLLLLYASALSAAVGLSLTTAVAKRDEPLLRCALALLINWIVGMGVSYAGWTDAWPINIPIDAVTAYVILNRPAGKWQAALGVTYCIQIIAHVSYGARMTFGMEADAMEYYNQLTGVAFLQLALLGSWSLGLWRRSNSDSWGPRRATTLDAGTSGVVR